MTRVITIASGKGGVGKTTISANLSIALSILGWDVLVMDMDLNMANLELILGLEGKPVTLQEVLSGKEDIYDAIYVGPGGVKIIPAGLSLNNLKYIKRERLEDVFNSLIGDVEILLVDSPAGLERDALDAMSLADEIILVTTSEVTSVSDTLKTKLVADKMGIDIIGVVINRKKSNNEFLNTKEIEAILEVPIISIIPENPKLISCFASGQPLMIKEPESKTSNCFNQLASYLMGQSFHINNKGFVSRFIDGIIGNFPLKSKRH